jgi:hypothetical protein
MAYYSLRELDDEAKAEVASFEDFLAAAYRRLACSGVSAEEKAFWDQSSARYSIYLHYWYKCTKADSEGAALLCGEMDPQAGTQFTGFTGFTGRKVQILVKKYKY